MTDVPESYDDYRTSVSNPRFIDWLRERAEPAWTNAVEHRFTRELGCGTLSEAIFAAKEPSGGPDTRQFWHLRDPLQPRR